MVAPAMPRDANGSAIQALAAGIVSVSTVVVNGTVQLNATPTDGVVSLLVYVPSTEADGIQICDSGGAAIAEVVPGQAYPIDAVKSAQATFYAKPLTVNVNVQVTELG